MVFDPLPAGAPDARRTPRAADHPPGGAAPLHAAAVEPACPRPGPGRTGSRTSTSTSPITSRHVALPAPGDDGQLCDWAAEFFSHPLDRTRPLWELALIEGLAHGRWALGIKMHRCLIDGLGSVAMTDALLDTEPDPEFTTRVRRRRRAGRDADVAAPAGRDGSSDGRRTAGGERRRARGAAPDRGVRTFGCRRRARPRGDLRCAAYVAQRADRAVPPVRGRAGAAARAEGDPPRARRIGQRCRARRLHRGPAPAARGPR